MGADPDKSNSVNLGARTSKDLVDSQEAHFSKPGGKPKQTVPIVKSSDQNLSAVAWTWFDPQWQLGYLVQSYQGPAERESLPAVCAP